jgi:hypothetical protein
MRTAQLARPQLAPFEFDSRFSLAKGLYFATGVAPHAFTTRVSITVPSGQRGLLLNGFILIMRETTATSPGMTRAVMEVAGVEILAEAREFSTTVRVPNVRQVFRGDIFNPGDNLTISTVDPSDTGTYTYILSDAVLLGPLT